MEDGPVSQFGTHEAGRQEETRRMKAFFKNVAPDEAGLEVVEYAILTGLIVVSLIVTFQSIGAWVIVQFQAVVN